MNATFQLCRMRADRGRNRWPRTGDGQAREPRSPDAASRPGVICRPAAAWLGPTEPPSTLAENDGLAER